MKKFNFRFSALLNLRKQESGQLLAQYAIILKEYNQAITQKEVTQQQLSDLLDKKKMFLKTGQNQMFTTLLSQTKSTVNKIEESLTKIKTKMTPWQEKIKEKQKQIEVLEKLREQDQFKHRKKQAHKEQLLLEESYGR